jgi:hypothetical protein
MDTLKDEHEKKRAARLAADAAHDKQIQRWGMGVVTIVVLTILGGTGLFLWAFIRFVLKYT